MSYNGEDMVGDDGYGTTKGEVLALCMAIARLGVRKIMTKQHDFGQGPVPAHRHPNGGGWVADTATVHETAYVAGEVDQFASVGRNAWVGLGAWVGDCAVLYPHARVDPHAHVGRGVRVGEDSLVKSWARVPAYSTVPDCTTFPAPEEVQHD